jgi:hypothetical protein
MVEGMTNSDTVYTELMKPIVTVLVLCPCLALSAWSQTSPTQPFSQVGQFLSLTNEQISAIIENNNDYNSFSFQQQRQIQQAQAQIALEIAKDPLDPTTIGNLYASIETTCRALRDKASSSQQQNIAVLTDVQKAKMNVLDDAIKLIPTISEAQSGNLLGSAGSPPFSFTAGASFISTFSRSSGVPGCGVNGVIGGIFGGILPPPPPGQHGVAGLSTPAPINRPLNHWFDRTDFYRGGFETLIKPQTKTQ